MLDAWALFDGRVRDDLGRDRLATTAALVRDDEHARLAVVYAAVQRLGRESGEDSRVDGTDVRASKERSNGLPCYGQVHQDGVAFLDAERPEHIGDAADLAEEQA